MKLSCEFSLKKEFLSYFFDIVILEEIQLLEQNELEKEKEKGNTIHIYNIILFWATRMNTKANLFKMLIIIIIRELINVGLSPYNNYNNFVMWHKNIKRENPK